VGAVESAVRIVCLDQSVDALGVSGDGDANFSIWPLRQSMFFDPFPGCAPVRRAVEPAAWATAGKTPRSAPRLPQGGKQNVGVVRIKGDVDAAAVLVFVENLVPGLAAVAGP